MKTQEIILILVLFFGIVLQNSCVKKEVVTLPEIATNPVDSITENSAMSGGNITNEGGMHVIARGVCWNAAQNPTINDSLTKNGNGLGTFEANITGLLPNNTYYVRAYATNEIGTAYGKEDEFRTIVNLPQIRIDSISNRTMHTAIAHGNLIDLGTGNNVTQYGHCWSPTNLNPDMYHSLPHEHDTLSHLERLFLRGSKCIPILHRSLLIALTPLP